MSAMEVLDGNQLQLAISVPSPSPSYGEMLEAQRELFHSQIGELQNIVLAQCKLTGVNPLSQEMAAGALSIKIGKRPRDLLNPKAVKYMHSVFSIKDAITKKECREISALFGITITQVREFFMSQRSRVRKFIRVARQKAVVADASNEVQDGTPISMEAEVPIHPVPLNCVGPSGGEVPSCSTPYESLPDLDDSDRYFFENIFAFMRKEETFSGQVKLMDWIMQIHNCSLLFWFLTRGGVMVLATWLSQAATEEQTSVLHVILKVLCHLPLNKALPEHMSAILHSVNRLRFYPSSDISNRARLLLSRWSKLFARSQAMKKPNAVKSAVDTHNELLLKQSIDEIMGHESWESKKDCHEDALALSLDGSENIRKLESPQPLKLLPSSADDYSKKFIRGVSSSQTRERRKVLLMEQPGQKSVGRNTHVARVVPANRSRPLSADDIQKAKLRAQFMQQKYGKIGASSGEGREVKVETGKKVLVSQAKVLPPQVQEQKEPLKAPVDQKASHLLSSSEVMVQPETPLLMPSAKVQVPLETSGVDKMDLDLEEPLWSKSNRVQIEWHTPPEVMIHEDWGVATGGDSKEVEIQNNRIRREKETVYGTFQEIPSDPKEPWDREMDYDDTLTPEIPTEQPPEQHENSETAAVAQPSQGGESSSVAALPPVVPPQNSNGPMPEPDLELLAELLKTPELVFALTAGQGGGSLSSQDIVKLLDLIKTNGVASVVGSFTALGKNVVQSAQVSLPSPTPSSDPVTSGWRPEAAVNNPFSRQKPPAATTVGVHFGQPPQARHALPPLSQQQGSYHQPVNFPPQTTATGRHSGSQMLQQQQHPQSELGGNNNQYNRRSPLPNFSPESSSGYNKPAPSSLAVNRQQNVTYHHHHDAALLHSPTPPRTQPQHLMAPLQQHPNPYSRTNNNNNQLNYNAFGGGPPHPRDGGRFQSWGPEDYPNEQMPGRRYQEGPNMNVQQHGNRAESGRWNSSEYREGGRRGNDQRWRDRRR